jgi:hypothetical protein
MSVATAAPYWLVIVEPGRPELEAKLRRTFGDGPLVQVLVDRRKADRRRQTGSVSAERRRRDRRQPLASSPTPATAAYRILERGDGFRVLQAVGRVGTQCDECGMALDFEMPRFAEVPARLELRVIHSAHASLAPARAQHTVEAQAFRRSGRPFLACRMIARRRITGGSPLFSLS